MLFKLAFLLLDYSIHPTTQFMAFFSGASSKWGSVLDVVFVGTFYLILTKIGHDLFSNVLICLSYLGWIKKLHPLRRKNAISNQPKITLSTHNKKMEKLLKKLERETDYSFVYKSGLFENEKPVSIRVKDVTIEEIIQCVLGQLKGNYQFAVKEQIITIRRKKGTNKHET